MKTLINLNFHKKISWQPFFIAADFEVIISAIFLKFIYKKAINAEQNRCALHLSRSVFFYS